MLMVLLLQYARDGVWPWFARCAAARAAARRRCRTRRRCRARPRPRARRRAARSARGAQGVRRPRRRQRPELRDPRRRDPRPDRPERRRQEHDVQPDHRRAAADARARCVFRGASIALARASRSRGSASRAPSSTCKLIAADDACSRTSRSAPTCAAAPASSAAALRLDRAEERRTACGGRAPDRARRPGRASMRRAAGNLPLGQQRMVEIARALAADPIAAAARRARGGPALPGEAGARRRCCASCSARA